MIIVLEILYKSMNTEFTDFIIILHVTHLHITAVHQIILTGYLCGTSMDIMHCLAIYTLETNAATGPEFLPMDVCHRIITAFEISSGIYNGLKYTTRADLTSLNILQTMPGSKPLPTM